MKAKAMVVTARPPSPFAYESVASGRGLGEHQRVRESVQKRIIHTRRFFLGFFPGSQREPSHKRPSLWLSGRPKGHEGIGGSEARTERG